MQTAAAISRSPPVPDGRRPQVLPPRILAAVVVALTLHGVLLFGRGTGATSTTLQSQSQSRSLAVRFVELTTTSRVAPSTSLSAASLPRPEPDTRAMRDVPSPVETTAEKPIRLSRPTERSTASGSAQPSTPVAPASPEASAERPRSSLSDASDYWLAHLLSVGPRPLGDIEPAYPEGADQRSGKVVLRVLISETGRVDEVSVVRANPPDLFDASAVEAFSKARFSPGLAGGIAVKSQITVEVEFVPLNRLSRISGRSY